MSETTDQFSEAVANAVRAEISRRQRPVSEVAAAIGVSKTTMYKLLNGGAPFDILQLGRVADYLGIPLQNIIDSARLGQRVEVAS